MFKKILFFGRKNDKNSEKLLSYIRKKSLNVNVIWSVNSDDKLKSKKILNQNYDYIFCFRSFYILKKNLLKKAKYAAINFHPGIPKYRGTGCANYAMYKNEKYYGTTAHIMHPEIDKGTIINVRRFKILKRNSVETLLEKAHKILLKQALETINLLNKNPANLDKLIYKSKNEKWSNIIKKRKHLDEFYSIKKNTSRRTLIKKIRACYIRNSFRPYIKLHNFIFVLADPYYEKKAKKKKYKMYYNIPSDLIKKI